MTTKTNTKVSINVANAETILEALADCGVHIDDGIEWKKAKGGKLNIAYELQTKDPSGKKVKSLEAALRNTATVLDVEPKDTVSTFEEAPLLTLDFEDYRYELLFVEDDELEFAQMELNDFDGTGIEGDLDDDFLEPVSDEEEEVEIPEIPVVTIKEVRTALKKVKIVVPLKPTEKDGNEYVLEFAGSKKAFETALEVLEEELEMESVPDPEAGYARQYVHGEGRFAFTVKVVKTVPTFKMYVLDPEIADSDEEEEEEEVAPAIVKKHGREKPEATPVVSSKRNREVAVIDHQDDDEPVIVPASLASLVRSDLEGLEAMRGLLMLQIVAVDTLIAASKKRK